MRNEKLPLLAAAGGELDLDRDHARRAAEAARDGGGAVLVHRAHRLLGGPLIFQDW